MPAITPITSDELHRQILRRGTRAVVDFYQASCAPCRALEPRLERIAGRYLGRVAAYRVDLDNDPDAAQRFDVLSLPTVLAIVDGQETARLDGLITDPQLQQLFDQLAPEARR